MRPCGRAETAMNNREKEETTKHSMTEGTSVHQPLSHLCCETSSRNLTSCTDVVETLCDEREDAQSITCTVGVDANCSGNFVAFSSSAAAMTISRIGSEGASPREILRCLLPNVTVPDDMPDNDLVHVIRQLLYTERYTRTKLNEYNTFMDAVELFRRSCRIIILTGAGVSVSCGIPDFRSKDGIYARLHVQYPDLPDPTAMFDISYFAANPKPFFEFAQELFPGRYKPSVSHYFIKALEDEEKLLRNYTQNIDTLEQIAGITRVVQCHGSFARATCRNCGVTVGSEVIEEDIISKRVAMCRVCNDPKGVLKPDIVFFGEDLPEEFHEKMGEDVKKADLVVVIGSSLKVQPVALLPFNVERHVPQILINRESLPHYAADIELLGDCDEIVTQLILALGFPYTVVLQKSSKDTPCKDYKYTSQRRLPLTEEQFKSLLDEPEKKRIRVEDDLQHWESRYVSITSKLPDDAFLFVAPNRNVFPGAEMAYDCDLKVFRQVAEHCRSSLTSTVNSSESGRSRAPSRAVSVSEYERWTPSDGGSLRRANSCPLTVRELKDASNGQSMNSVLAFDSISTRAAVYKVQHSINVFNDQEVHKEL